MSQVPPSIHLQLSKVMFPGTNSPLTNTDVEYVATGDFNGDGITDVATANTDGTVKVQIGIGNNTFQSAVSYAVSSNLNVIQVADVNGDGKVDLIVVSANDGTVSILLGNGNGHFRRLPVLIF